jgi:type II secretory pathway component PulK
VTAAPRHRGERGIILIAVLLAVAIMAVMVVAAAALTRAGIGNEQLEQRRLASHLALRSGLESAKALILATPEDKRIALAGGDASVDLGNGVTATVRLQDAGGYVDLNRSDPKLIEAVARFSGLGKAAEGLAEKIAKMRKDAEPRQTANGTPPSPPQPGKPPAAPGGKPASPGAGGAPAKQPPVPILFLAVDQLPAMLGISPEDAQALGAGLTVYNPTGQINPLAAPDQVLQSIPGLTGNDISEIATARKMGTGTADPRLQQLIQRLPGVLSLAPPRVFMVDVKLDGGAGILPGSAVRAVVRLTPEGQMPFGTLALEEE